MKILSLWAASLMATAALVSLPTQNAAAQGVAATTQQIPPHAETRSIAVRELIGERVMTEQGETLGEVTRVLSSNRETYFLAVSSGGFLGIGTKTAALAVPRMQMMSGGTLVMPGMTKEQFDSLTDIMEGRLPTAPSDALVPMPVN